MTRRTVETLDAAGADDHLEWVSISSPMFVGDPSGDAFYLESTASGVRFAALDGRGHGPEAAHAAEVIVASMRAQPDVAIEALLKQANQDASDTRGAAITLVSYDVAARRITWVALSNVVGSLSDPDQRRQAPKISGFLGFRFPDALPVETQDVAPGTTMILATDGLDPSIGEASIDPTQSLPSQARSLFHQMRRGTDDALLVLLRFR